MRLADAAKIAELSSFIFLVEQSHIFDLGLGYATGVMY
jgi:hypothetical protein